MLHHQTYPKGWTDTYTEEAYALRDPIIAWGFSETGTTRWSEIEQLDPLNILGKAKAYGMNFGLASVDRDDAITYDCVCLPIGPRIYRLCSARQ